MRISILIADEIVNEMAPMHDEMSDEIHRLQTETLNVFVDNIKDSGESLSSDAYAVVNDEMSTEADALRRENSKIVSDVLSVLHNVKETIRAIDALFRPVVGLKQCHSKRRAKAREFVSTGLEKKLRINDSKINVKRSLAFNVARNEFY